MSTKVPAVGVLVPYARSGVGVIATQARVNLLLGYDGLDLLERAHSAEETLEILLNSDSEPEKRQVSVVDVWVSTAAHTGAKTDPRRGQLMGEGYAVTGNLLVGVEVLDAMAESFEAAAEEPLRERPVRALEAGQEAGGDCRGRQSAAIKVAEGQPYPYLDLRVDEHPDPVIELRRIYEVARIELLPFVEALPTQTNSKGDFGEEMCGTLIPNVNNQTNEGCPNSSSIYPDLNP